MSKYILCIIIWIGNIMAVYAQDYAILEGQMDKGKINYLFDGKKVSSPDLINVLHNKKIELKVSETNSLDLIVIIDSNVTLDAINNLKGIIAKIDHCNPYYLVRYMPDRQLSELFIQYKNNVDRNHLDDFIKQKRQLVKKQTEN